MFKTIRSNYSLSITAILFVGLALSMIIPTFASAATYAYVDVSGDVRSITASDWQTAISIAPSIHAHSGVLLLSSALDYNIVGDNVAAF